jgi:hypothetical protein
MREREDKVPDAGRLHNREWGGYPASGFQYDAPTGFAGLRGEGCAYPTIAHRYQLIIDENQRQALSFPGRDTSILEQFLEFMVMPTSRQAQAFPAAPQAHMSCLAARTLDR